MISKPPGCSGCPAEHRGHFFTPDDHKPSAKVRFVAQGPGKSEIIGKRFVRWFHDGEEGTGEVWEADVPRPMIGKTGYELDHTFLPKAGITRDDVEVCNAIRCRFGDASANGTDELPSLTTTFMRETIKHCMRAYWREPSAETAVVALGGHALWALTGEYAGDDDDADSADDDLRASTSVDGWRGWLVPYKPQWTDKPSARQIFCTYHPSYYYRRHWYKPVGKMDFARLGRYLRGTWPEPFPEISVVEPDEWPDVVAFDTEYFVSSKQMIRYSVAWREYGQDERDDPKVHVIEATNMQTLRRPSWSEQIGPGILQRLTLLSTLLQDLASGTRTVVEIQAVWDHCRRVLGDSGQAGRPLRDLLKISSRDEQEIHNVILRSLSQDKHVSGIAVSLLQSRIREFWGRVGTDGSGVPLPPRPHRVIAQNLEADFPFLKSVFGRDDMEWDDCMFAHSVLYGTLRHSLDFMGSCYARHNRWKHLQQSDPLVYSGMDALATYDIWHQLARELARDEESRALYEHELKPLLPHVMARPHVRLNAMHIAEAAQELEREQDQIAKRGAAVAGWPLNVSSADQVSRWLRLKSDE